MNFVDIKNSICKTSVILGLAALFCILYPQNSMGSINIRHISSPQEYEKNQPVSLEVNVTLNGLYQTLTMTASIDGGDPMHLSAKSMGGVFRTFTFSYTPSADQEQFTVVFTCSGSQGTVGFETKRLTVEFQVKVIKIDEIQVILQPQEVVESGAQWSLDGGGWNNSGQSLDGIEPGNHIVDFKPVSGWLKPAPVTVRTLRDFTLTKTANYQIGDVTFSEAPSLPLEADVIALESISKDTYPENGRDFIEVQEATASIEIPFNREYTLQKRSTKNVSIAGKTVIFEEGHENNLYNYNNDKTIENMYIYAETVWFKSPLYLPQTHVLIYAKEIRFEENAYLRTTPVPFLLEQVNLVDGSDGHQAGTITLFVERFESQNLDQTGQVTPPFDLTGGAGQIGGAGRDGGDGFSRTDSVGNEWDTPHPNSTLQVVRHLNTIGQFGESHESTVTEGHWNEGSYRLPENGEDAVSGGAPGNGGQGGGFICNLDLHSYVVNEGGEPGKDTLAYTGGSAGQPNHSYRYERDEVMYFQAGVYENGDWTLMNQHNTADGADAPGITGNKGVPGVQTIQPSNPLVWMHPSAVNQILVYAKKAFRDGYIDCARETLEEYSFLLHTLLDNFSEDMTESDGMQYSQMVGEMDNLLFKIANDLDYFGNPFGWVPMLSFEVRLEAMKEEINTAFDVWYMTYWISKKNDEGRKSVADMQALNDYLNSQIADLQQDYNGAVQEISDLQTLALNVQTHIDELQQEIQALEEQFLQEAQLAVERQNFLSNLCQKLGTICTMIPTPYTQAAGAVLTSIADFDTDNPYSSAGSLATTLVGIDFSAETNFDFISNVESGDGQKVAQNAVSFGNKLLEAKDVLSQTQVSDDEVAAELAKIEEADPEFQAKVTAVNALLEQQQELAQQTSYYINLVSEIPAQVLENLNVIDGLTAHVEDVSSVLLDQQTTQYLSRLEQRQKDMLEKYVYYMIKSYEYRMLEPYPCQSSDSKTSGTQQVNPFDLSDLIDRFEALGDTLSDGQGLSESDYQSLQSVFEDNLSIVANQIFNYFEENQYSQNTFTLSLPGDYYQDILDELNTKRTTTINFEELGLFLTDQYEDVRVNDITITGLDIDVIENIDRLNFDLFITHGGVSNFYKKGKIYEFAHKNLSGNDQSRSYSWGVNYDLTTNKTTPQKPSDANRSLLTAVLDTLDNDDVLLYSRPGGWADFQINAPTHSFLNYEVKNVTIEVTIDYQRRNDRYKILDVMVSNPGLNPLFTIDKIDRNNRQNGAGRIRRVYNNDETITVTAETSYGNLRFNHWTSPLGSVILYTDPSFQKKMDEYWKVQAVYVPQVVSMAELTPAIVHDSGDLDGSGYVDENDREVLASNWNQPYSNKKLTIVHSLAVMDNWNTDGNYEGSAPPVLDVQDPTKQPAIRLIPDRSSVTVGDTVTFTLEADSAGEAVRGGVFAIEYDPHMFSFVDVFNGIDIHAGSPFELTPQAILRPGRLEFTMSGEAMNPAAYSGALISFRLKAIQTNPVSSVGFDETLTRFSPAVDRTGIIPAELTVNPSTKIWDWKQF